jgi:hypothetical protein
MKFPFELITYFEHISDMLMLFLKELKFYLCCQYFVKSCLKCGELNLIIE